MSTFGVTLSRHLLEMELRGRDDDAEISVLISQLAFAGKILSREMGRAALVGRLGLVGNANATGDAQKKLDVYSNSVVLDAISLGGFVAGVVSEELEDVRVVACGEDARYILCVDPLDGSANTDIDGAVATIFAIYRKARPGCEDVLAELVGGAVELVSAGYVLYGPSTIFVYTFRDGVHGFTLDASLGEFLLSHENVRCPTRGRYYSTNVGRMNGWHPNLNSLCLNPAIHAATGSSSKR